MRIFNRIVVILLLAGLFALGLSTTLYSFEIADYQLENLQFPGDQTPQGELPQKEEPGQESVDEPGTLGLNDLYEGLDGFIGSLENGPHLNPLDVTTLVIIALLGLVLLILELKPPSPRRVRMQQGTYITRSAVESEAIDAVEQDPEVLQSNVSVKAQRKPGASVDVRASIRAGEDVESIQSEVRNRVQQRLDRMGIPVANLKVRIVESDPRERKTRVH